MSRITSIPDRKKLGERKKVLIPVIMVVLITIAAAYFIFRPALPNPTRLEMEDVPDILASNEFWNLSPERRHAYVQEAVESFVIRTAAQYARQPPEAREEFLENLITRGETMSRRFRGLNLPATRDLEREGREAREAARRDYQERFNDRSASRTERAMQHLRLEAERFDAESRAQMINLMIDLHRHLENR